MTPKRKALVRAFGLAAAVVFAAVGLCFLIVPAGVLDLFSRLSGPLGFTPAAASAPSPFFVALAASYMFVVTILALQMHRHPEDGVYALILAQAKLASATISLVLFFAASRALILLVNVVVDGLIGLSALLLAGWMKRDEA